MEQLATNIALFARMLRSAGLKLGTGQVAEAQRAAILAGAARREDFRAALFATLVTHPGEIPIFDQAFDLFWRDPGLVDRALLSETTEPADTPQEPDRTPGARRLANAMGTDGTTPPVEAPPRLEIDARDTASAIERLSRRDFEQMDAREIDEARRAIARLRWNLPLRRSRRTVAAAHGPAFDMRRTLRGAMKTGGDILHLARRTRLERQPPLVVLCDISGSMSVYARMCLHFLHALTQARKARAAATHVFLFGTALTNVSRALRQRDPDAALAAAAAMTQDWDGGTRIGAALERFNRDWSRRVLTGGAIVLLVTDGLEREDAGNLAVEAARLRRNAVKVIWLNPLLRYEAFAPKARGVRTLIQHVDELRPVHNLESLAGLAAALDDGGAGNMLGKIGARAA